MLAPLLVVLAICCSRQALALQKRAASPGIQPVLHKEPCEVYFHNSLPDGVLEKVNLTLFGGVYGEEICAGSADAAAARFVRDPRDAPPDFCILRNLQAKLAFGNPNGDGAPFEFDQFALERVMLGKWLADPSRCANAEDASVVVVPSYQLQSLLSRFDGVQSKWTDVYHVDKDELQEYWDRLRTTFYKPSSNYAPTIVVHISTTWMDPAARMILDRLMMQPVGFRRRVVVAALERDVESVDSKSRWSSLMQKTTQMADARTTKDEIPLLVSLPYPLNVARPVSFMQSNGQFDASLSRPILVSATFSMAKGGGHSHIRSFLQDTMRALDLREATSKLVSTAQGLVGTRTLRSTSSAVCSTLLNASCGIHIRPTFWEVAVKSSFCLEPAGDTLTRSHFFVAIMSGCVPVIFEGGHDSYEHVKVAAWPFRFGTGGLRADVLTSAIKPMYYEEFAVVYQAQDVMAGRIDVISDLAQILTNDPERYTSLRRGLEKAAHRLQFLSDDVGACGDDPDSCENAFTGFRKIVRKAAESNMGQADIGSA